MTAPADIDGLSLAALKALVVQLLSKVAWQTHLDRRGIRALQVTPDPVCIATEGALWGSVQAHGLLRDMVIVSDDAGQFAVG